MATDREPIRGQVARLITGDELIINRGLEHGVKVRMLFEVLDRLTEHVRDPETKEDLGSIRRVKATVRVTSVEQKLCLAVLHRSSAGFGLGPLGSAAMLAGLFAPSTSVAGATGPKAPTSPSTWAYGVAVGDPVEELVERASSVE